MKSKTLVCVNVLDHVDSQVYGSHSQEWFRLGRNTSDDFILFHPNRLSIDNARNQAARFALEQECDFLYFIDDDMILHPNTYASLKKCRADIAQALTFIRGNPFHCMAFKKVNENNLDYFDDYSNSIDHDGIVECEAVGFACALIRCDVLKKINPPYFVTSSQTTEDIYFCLKLRQKLERDVRIVVDTKVPTHHLLQPEAVSVFNVNRLKQTYAVDIKSDRGKEYLDQCKTALNIS